MQAGRRERIASAAHDLYSALRAMMRIVRKEERDLTLIEKTVPRRFVDAIVALFAAVEDD